MKRQISTVSSAYVLIKYVQVSGTHSTLHGSSDLAERARTIFWFFVVICAEVYGIESAVIRFEMKVAAQDVFLAAKHSPSNGHKIFDKVEKFGKRYNRC